MEEVDLPVSAASSAKQYLQETIRGVLSKKDFNLPSERCRKMHESGCRLIDSMIEPDNYVRVAKFLVKLIETLDSVIVEASRMTTCVSQREKAWSSFHKVRCTLICDQWLELCQQIKVFGTNPLLFQTVTRELFETRMKIYFSKKTSQSRAIVLEQEITDDEKNVIMYACGYVPVALIHRYEKRKESKYAMFVQCLLQMAIGVYEDSFYEYARKWFESVNRGGAFEVSDCTFNFFLVLEQCVRSTLPTHLTLNTNQKDVVDEIMAIEDLQFHWSMLSANIEDEVSDELLRDVVALWLTIRGFSITGAWTEQISSIRTKSGLRKDLKKSSKKK